MTMVREMEVRTIHVSVREARLVADRVLLTLNVPGGYIPAVREVILTSESLGLGGFAHLLKDHAGIAAPYLDAVTVREDAGGGMLVEGGGIHAWVLLPTVIDLLVEGAQRAGRAEMILGGVRQPGELAIMSALASRYGAVVDVQGDAGTGRTRATARNGPMPRSLENWDPLLVRAMRHHFAVAEPMWRSLYDLSNRALAPDSVLSRRHAGPVVLLEDGTILGRQPADDDFDPKMLQFIDEKGSS
jgi:hypothetical protein